MLESSFFHFHSIEIRMFYDVLEEMFVVFNFNVFCLYIYIYIEEMFVMFIQIG